jgi:hypothetical protein
LDWELVYRLSRRIRTQHVPVPTVRYRVNLESYYTDWSEIVHSDVSPADAAPPGVAG